MQTYRALFSALAKNEYLTISAISFLISINSLLYLAVKNNLLSFIHFSSGTIPFLFIFAALLFWLGHHLFSLRKKLNFRQLLRRALFAMFFPEIIFILALQASDSLNPFFGLVTALYIFFAVIYVSSGDFSFNNIGWKQIAIILRSLFSRNNIGPGIIIIVIVAVNLFFGIRDIGKFAAVDEPLWTYDRIPDFWKNIANMNWRNTRVSDKPGVTVAAISGAGLLFEKNPKQFKDDPQENETWPRNENTARMESFNTTFRLPLYILCALSLPLFYFLISKLAGRNAAIVSSILIGLSPILIGNSRIINPDGLLWTFTPLSIVSYLVFIKNRKLWFLYLSAFLLGLAILTKYTANILYIYFFGLIFIEYILNYKKYSPLPFKDYLIKNLSLFTKFVFISMSVFYLLYPAVWEKPDRILLGTFLSQPFAPILPFFAASVLLVLADLFLKSRILSPIMKFLGKIRAYLLYSLLGLFIISILFTLFNVYSSMSYIDFESILSSPKSSYSFSSFWGFFLSNFYPLVFGVFPLVIFAILIFFSITFIKKDYEGAPVKTAAYLAIFILAYYFGSALSNVASTIRYQIIIYPLLFILAGIALANISVRAQSFLFGKNKNAGIYFIAAILITIHVFILSQVQPQYTGYASSLLPNRYFIDIKDMGSGSYEAAQFLNSLPNAANLKVWSDKAGVCAFFEGQCASAIDAKFFNSETADYFVLSSGRKSKLLNLISHKTSLRYDFNELHDTQITEFKLEIAGRPNNYVKIVRPEIGLRYP